MAKEEEFERHDADIRINRSGHKELVVKKKGKKDIETLNELADDVLNMLEGAGFNKTSETIDNITGAIPRASNSYGISKDKSKFKANVQGNESQNKYITGRDAGLKGLTHNESFTGTGAIAIAPSVTYLDDEEDDEDNVESTLESVMSRNVLNEWEPKFAGGGDYNPNDYQMPSPTGNGVADRKPKKDKVGQYDTDTSQHGEAWPRKHNDTAAMCDVDENGVENKPQGSHESTHGEPTDGHQTELGHNWPNQPKNSGNGVAEPFEGNRWSDGGTLTGGSGQDEMTNSGRKQSMPSSGPIKGTSGPQLGQPQESWSPSNIGALMESDGVDIQRLFDSYARQTEYVCLEDFQQLLLAYGCDAILNENSIVKLMADNRELVFHEGCDASGRYWVGVPLTEGKKPWEDDNEEEDGEDDCETMEESRSRRARTLNEFQVRSPEDEAMPYGGMGPGSRRPMGDPDFGDDMMGDVTDDMGADSYDDMLGMSNQDDAMHGPGPFDHGDTCPECGAPDTGEDSCPECGMHLGAGEEAGFGAYNDDWHAVDDNIDHGFQSDLEKDDMWHDDDTWDDPMESVRSPKMMESLSNFLGSAKNIVERNRRDFNNSAIGEALQLSWNHYARNVDPRHAPSKARYSIQKLMESYPTFNPLLENDAMDNVGGKGVAAGKGSNGSSFLAEKDNPGPDQMEEHGDPLGKKQKNTLDGTPVIKGTEKGMSGTGNNAKSVKENVSRLAAHTKRRLMESAKGIRGKYGVSFTVLVNENGGKNRTVRRTTLAEALVDVEEILQLHPHQNVALECYFYQNRTPIRKTNIPMIQIKKRGPIVSEGKALFRFKRTAESFADELVTEGATCRISRHNWGHSVSAKVNYKLANKAFIAISESRR